MNLLRLFQVTWKVMQSSVSPEQCVLSSWFECLAHDNAETWTPTETKSVKLQKILHWVSFLGCKTIMWHNIYLRNSISMWRDCGWSKFKVSILLSLVILTLDWLNNLQLAFESVFFLEKSYYHVGRNIARVLSQHSFAIDLNIMTFKYRKQPIFFIGAKQFVGEVKIYYLWDVT